MRVTNRMIHENALRGLMQGAEGMQAARERVLDAKRLHRPSDDPIGVTNAIKLRDAMGEMDQFLRNIGAAERTLGAAETALSSATDIVQRARELAIQAANSWPSPGDRQLIAPEVEHLARQLASLASAKIGDAYLFSGFRTDVAPYAPPPPGSADAGAYLGDAGAVIARVSPGITLQVNVTADSAFGPALAALKQLHDELTAGTAVTPGTLVQLDAGLDAVLRTRAVVGARSNRLEGTRLALEDAQLAGRRLLSEVEDVDLAEAVTQLREREAVYQAALAATGRILGHSLFDYLR